MLQDSIKMLTYGRLSEGFHQFIKDEYPAIDISLASNKQEAVKLLPNCNAVAGFNFLTGLDIAHLKWIHSFGAGVESFMKLDLPKTCTLSRTSGKMGQRIGEYCLAYLLHEVKGIENVRLQQKESNWHQTALPSLENLTIMILGTGSIGQGIASVLKPLCKQLTGVNQSGHSIHVFTETTSMDKLQLRHKIDADVIINALPSTPDTINLFNHSFFQKTKNTIFINIGRGDAVNENDLIQALNDGMLKKAILDVFQQEPLPEEHPFWQHPKCIATPHHSGLTNLDDAKHSFRSVFPAVSEQKSHPLIADLSKGY
jgi:glyoxylate/hydroxypyruvate reductase A